MEEYGSWMVEGTPSTPYGGYTTSLLQARCALEQIEEEEPVAFVFLSRFTPLRRSCRERTGKQPVRCRLFGGSTPHWLRKILGLP
eukprot:853678-Amphidinium_carterae.1